MAVGRLAVDDIHVDVAAQPDDAVHHRLAQDLSPPGDGGLAGDDLGHVVPAGVVDQCLGDRGARHGEDLRAQAFGQGQIGGRPVAGLGVVGRRGRLDVQRQPLGAKFVGQTFGRAHQPLAEGAGPNGNEQSLGYGPGAGDSPRGHIGEHLGVDLLRGPAEGDLAQRREVSLAEELLDRPCGLGRARTPFLRAAAAGVPRAGGRPVRSRRPDRPPSREPSP